MIKRLFFGPPRFVLPGRGLTVGITMTYLSLMLIIPVITLGVKATQLDWGRGITLIMAPQVQSALGVSLGTSAMAAVVNGVFGTIVAWVQVRYSYPGKPIVNALIDLPFAIPTAVAGITLTHLLSDQGWVGQVLTPLGWHVNYTWMGIVVALVFVGLPFVIRSVEPVLADIEPEIEEAAATLGASSRHITMRILIPTILPAILSGVTVAFARGLGEYGSVVFISGNLPFKTEILPYLIVSKLEQFDYEGATVLAILTLGLSFVALVVANGVQWWCRRRMGAV
ncbi:sulfate ABC transporter permease subunit CysT [bacterium]|nr:sulfate ABC transporter permease subunit CysT [bacterium]